MYLLVEALSLLRRTHRSIPCSDLLRSIVCVPKAELGSGAPAMGQPLQHWALRRRWWLASGGHGSEVLQEVRSTCLP